MFASILASGCQAGEYALDPQLVSPKTRGYNPLLDFFSPRVPAYFRSNQCKDLVPYRPRLSPSDYFFPSWEEPRSRPRPREFEPSFGPCPESVQRSIPVIFSKTG